MNDPRPAMISARPFESRSTSAKSWNTRTGSSELSTVTALERRIRSVLTATAPSTTAGEETRKSGRWCSPMREHVESELIGELGLLHQVAHALAGADPAGEVCECGESEFHRRSITQFSCAYNYCGRESDGHERAHAHPRGAMVPDL